MPERWESELEKVDRLEPAAELKDRVGHVPTPDRRDAPTNRIAVGLVALAIFAGAGLFAWRAFDRSANEAAPQGAPSPTDLPHVVVVTCATDGTQATPAVAVTPRGVPFTVLNPGNMDEVVIVGTNSAAVAADIDLSASAKHIFELPPAPYMVGCFTNRNTPHGSPGEIAKTSGMVPVAVNDPQGLYVSDALKCSAGREHDTKSYGFMPAFSSQEAIVRHVVAGLERSDELERAGYPDVPEGLRTYRILRDNTVIGRVRFTAPKVLFWGGGSTLELQSCTDAGLSLSTNP